MKPLHVDLLPASRPPRWAWAAVAIALAAAAVLWALDAQQRHEVQRLRQQAQQRQQAERERVQVAAAAANQPRTLPPYQASAQALLVQKTHPWPTILATMESIALEGVTPVALDVATAERSARIELNATSYAAVLAYLSALNQGDPALQWSLLQINVAGEGRMSAALVLNARP